MRAFLLAFGYSVFLLTVGFYMEPWFPLGDWRWPFLGLLGFVPWVLTYYKEIRGWVVERTITWAWWRWYSEWVYKLIRKHWISELIGFGIAAFLLWVLVFPVDTSLEKHKPRVPPAPLFTEEEIFVLNTMGRTLTEPERHMRKIVLTPEEDQALSLMRLLLKDIETWEDNYPDEWEDKERTLRLAKRLSVLGLAPIDGYGRTDENNQTFKSFEWRHYLLFIIPNLEKFGMERALDDTRRHNDLHDEPS